MGLIRSFNVYLDLNQAKRNASVLAPLQASSARTALRRANTAVGAAAVVIIAVCVLLGLGVRRPAVYLVMAALLVVALAATGITIARIAGIEARSDSR